MFIKFFDFYLPYPHLFLSTTMSPVLFTEGAAPVSPVEGSVPALIVKNRPAPGVEEYYPLNEPHIGTPYSKVNANFTDLDQSLMCRFSGRVPPEQVHSQVVPTVAN